MNKESRTSYARIDGLVQGYQQAQIVLASVRLNLFSYLKHESMTTEEIADGLQTDPEKTRILCNALVALNLLIKEENRFSNSPDALKFLLPDSPYSRVSSLLHGALQYERWGGLHDAVKQGVPTPDERIDPGLLRGRAWFARAMGDIGRTSAAQTVEKLDLKEVRSLLDVGGGPGVYALEFVRQYPDLAVTVLDDSETLDIARENCSAEGLQGRVRLRPGDVFHDDLGEGFDMVFLSNLVHIYSMEDNYLLIKRCAQALNPGGRICIKDFVLDPSRTSPQGAAIFAVNMLVSTAAGNCYTESDIQSWFENAGIILEDVVELARHSRLVIGRKQ
jgi:ubiquinone/menaquinone biosynthesis C-methylase UbiE